MKKILKLFKKNKKDTVHERRMKQLEVQHNVRVDSKEMSDIEKMDAGFNGKTYSINGKDVDF